MSSKLRFSFIWVPHSLGGHTAAPYEGMRTTIRWQRYLDEHLQCARDVQWENITFGSESSLGSAVCRLATDEPLPDEWLKEGQLIEMLSGFRVLAVGRVAQEVP
ncbi:hypothetical protein GCM10022278_33510 [Allohahella marinimesophila]|uniref:Uncharacterized protein n=1 Tax=Allohahella marinimesophila TaxID=1054972 RepID=A0ABP7PYW9_9GAMM